MNRLAILETAMTAQDVWVRYMNDPVFHALVHQIMQAVKAKRVTITDVLDAVAVAEFILQEREGDTP